MLRTSFILLYTLLCVTATLQAAETELPKALRSG